MKNYTKLCLFLFFLTSTLICASCSDSGKSTALTAQDFVQKYSRAYNDGDVASIVKMTRVAKGQTEESFKDETKNDIKAKGFGYRAWTETRYVSENDKGKYIRVEVAVKGNPSSIVLLKEDGGSLKMVLNPSDYD